MEQQNDLLKNIANLNEDERSALFNVEELENRLEMLYNPYQCTW